MPQLPTEPQKVILPLGHATSDQSSMRWSGEGSPWWFVSNAQTHLGRMVPDFTVGVVPNVDGSREASVEPSTFGPYFFRDFLEHRRIVDADMRILAGDRELFVQDVGGVIAPDYVNITPLYRVGTVDVTNGSSTVNGTGTSWFDSAIHERSFFSVDYITWYEITNFGGNNTLSITPSFQGSTDSDIPYYIRRVTLYDDTHEPRSNVGFYMGTRLSDLYVCGTYIDILPIVSPIPMFHDYALYRIGMAIGPSQDPSAPVGLLDQEPLLGGSAPPEPGVQSLGQRMLVSGMGLMDTGHIILFTREYDSFNPEQSSWARLRWSSPVDDAEWLNEPAGFLDFAHAPGRPTAMVETARGFEFHFTRGIQLGIPTGLTSQPVAIQSTRASYGAAHPRAWVHYGGTTYFLDEENNLRAWDGQRDQIIMPALQVRNQILFQNPEAVSPDSLYYFDRLPQLALAYSQLHDSLVIYGVEMGDFGVAPFTSYVVMVNLSDGSITNREFPSDHLRGFSNLGRLGRVSTILSGALSGYFRRTPNTQQESRTHRIETISKAMDFGYPGYLKTITRVALNFRGVAPDRVDVSLGSGQPPGTFPDDFLIRFRRVDYEQRLASTGVGPPGSEHLQQLVWYPEQDGTEGGANAIGDAFEQARESWIVGFIAESISARVSELDSLEVHYQVLGAAEVDVDEAGE